MGERLYGIGLGSRSLRLRVKDIELRTLISPFVKGRFAGAVTRLQTAERPLREHLPCGRELPAPTCALWRRRRHPFALTRKYPKPRAMAVTYVFRGQAHCDPDQAIRGHHVLKKTCKTL